MRIGTPKPSHPSGRALFHHRHPFQNKNPIHPNTKSSSSSSSSSSWYRWIESTIHPVNHTVVLVPSHSPHQRRSTAVNAATTTTTTALRNTDAATITMKFSITTTRTTLTILVIISAIFFVTTSLHLMVHLQTQPAPLYDSPLLLGTPPFVSHQNNNHIHNPNDFFAESRRQLLAMLMLSSSTTTTTKTTTSAMPPAPQLPVQEFHGKRPSRQCTSPEKDVPWIFGTKSTCHHKKFLNTTTTTTTTSTRQMKMVQSRTSDRMCGYCMDDFISNDNDNHESSPRDKKELKFVQYLYNLSQELRALKEKECSSLIVYGVAFGEQYTHWLTRQHADPIPTATTTTGTTTDDNRNNKNSNDGDDVPFKMSPEQVQQLLQLHGPCFMTFVLAEHLDSNVTQAVFPNKNHNNNHKNSLQQKYYYSNDGLQLLIPIQRKDLPYTNMRRNTKIFKMIGPSYLFGDWVERVIWQDAKLVAYNVPHTILPINYFEYFFNVIHMTSIPRNTNSDDHVCASFMGLPYHKNTMGSQLIQPPPSRQTVHPMQRTVQFTPHCDAIIEASSKRPTISDDLHSVQYQCSTYYNQTEHLQQFQQQQQQQQTPSLWSATSALLDMISPPTPPQQQQQPHHRSALDDALIDSAFIVWDLRSERCQNFVATLSCTWLDEIHCYSDRDQVSFPYIFLQMGLQVIPTDVRMNYHNTIQNNHIKNFDTAQQQERLQQLVTPETHHRLFAHPSTPLQPIVHIAKSSCHWYYNNLNDCDFTQNDPPMFLSPSSLSQYRYSLPKILRPPRFLRKWIGYVPPNYKDPTPPPVAKLASSPNVFKLAVVVTGSFHRFIFQSSMKRFILSLTDQGHYVDYYLSLSMQKAPAYRSDQNYMNLLVNDPIFDKYINQNEDETVPLDEALIKARIHMVVQQQLEVAGANLRYITFQDNYSGMDSNPQVLERRKRAHQMYPNEDPDLRFPTLDIRDVTTMNRTANANRNMLNLFYHIQHAYQQVLAYEMDIRIQYDYVLFLRDDTMWLQNFDFRALVESNITATATANENFYLRTLMYGKERLIATPLANVELFVPSCDARTPSMHPAEINDHIAIVKRTRADIYGNYFDELFRTDLDSCAQRLDDKIRYGRSIQGISSVDEVAIPLRGCNSEMILQYVLEQKNVTIEKVGQGKIPFQRMALVKNPVTSKVHTCFHKFCQSHTDPLINHPGIKKCTELKF